MSSDALPTSAHVRPPRVIKALGAVCMLTALSASCGTPAVSAPRMYPLTGRTRMVELTAQDVRWEVGPSAIYNAWTYNGTIPGPVIDAVAGDRIVIRLSNPTAHPVSIHTHLVEFAQSEDGADPPSIAMPGQTITVTWTPRYAMTVPYHDHATHEGVRRGLVGALVVHAPDERPATEHVVVLSDLDSAEFAQLPGVADPVTGMIPVGGTFRGPHQYMHVINGKAYEESIAPFMGRVGSLSRWRVVSIGVEAHTWHIHGHRWVDADGTLTDNIQLSPGTYRTFELTPELPGNWLVHCHFPNHAEGGMMTRYMVAP